MSDNTQYTVTLKIDSGVIGHAFVTLQGPGQPAVTVGYYPVVHSPSAPGIVKDDASFTDPLTNQITEHPSDWSKTFVVSAGQYQAMLDEAAYVANHPGEYGVLGNQCTGFARDVLNAGGVTPTGVGQFIDGAAHPLNLRWAYDGLPENQIKPYRSDASGAEASIQKINDGIADNPTRLQSYIDDHIIPNDPNFFGGGYWFGAELNDSQWNSATTTTAQASALASTAIGIQLAGPVPPELLALQSKVFTAVNENLPSLGDSLTAYKDASGNVMVVGEQGSITIKTDGSIEVFTGNQIALNVKEYGAGAVRQIDLSYQKSNGISTATNYDEQGDVYQTSVTEAKTENVSLTSVYDGKNNLTKQTQTETFYDENGNQSRIDTVTDNTGAIRNVYDNDGNLFKSEVVSTGSSTLAYSVGATANFLILLRALQSGQPLPIATSGVNTLLALQAASGQSVSTSLAATGSALSALSSLAALKRSLDREDALGVLSSSAMVVSFSATAYVNLNKEEVMYEI